MPTAARLLCVNTKGGGAEGISLSHLRSTVPPLPCRPPPVSHICHRGGATTEGKRTLVMSQPRDLQDGQAGKRWVQTAQYEAHRATATRAACLTRPG